VLERYGARVERSFGDMLMAFSGFPIAHEDDTLVAVRAALEVRTADQVQGDVSRQGDALVARRSP
jgi:class 3 adenylate cyclase